jgi:hypothetical protein
VSFDRTPLFSSSGTGNLCEELTSNPFTQGKHA